MFTIIATDGRRWTLSREAAATIYANRGDRSDYTDRYRFAVRTPEFLSAQVNGFAWQELEGYLKECPSCPPRSWQVRQGV